MSDLWRSDRYCLVALFFYFLSLLRNVGETISLVRLCSWNGMISFCLRFFFNSAANLCTILQNLSFYQGEQLNKNPERMFLAVGSVGGIHNLLRRETHLSRT